MQNDDMNYFPNPHVKDISEYAEMIFSLRLKSICQRNTIRQIIGPHNIKVVLPSLDINTYEMIEISIVYN